MNETKSSLIAADATLIMVDAAAGVQVVTEKVWDYATEYDQPRAFVLNWMDRELASFDRAMESLQNVFGRGVVPIATPHRLGKRISRRGGSGRDEGADIHAGRRRQSQSGRNSRDWPTRPRTAHEALVELVAEGEDALMQEFFDEGTLPVEDLKKGLREAVLAKRIFPVLLSSALHNIGSRRDSEFPRGYFPLARRTRKNQRPQNARSQGRNNRAENRRCRAGIDFCV